MTVGEDGDVDGRAFALHFATLTVGFFPDTMSKDADLSKSSSAYFEDEFQ